MELPVVLLVVLLVLYVAGSVGYTSLVLLARALGSRRARPETEAREDSHAVTGELADLAAAERTLARLVRLGRLEAGLAAQVAERLAERRRQLTEVEPAPAPIPAPASPAPGTPVAAPPPVPPGVRLERLLLSAPQDVAAWSAADREGALVWHDQLSPDQRARMAPPAQLSLARLLAAARRPADALPAYRRWLAAGPTDARFATVALEAARFAVRVDRRADAEALLRQALAAPLPAAARQEAERLERELAPAPEPGVPAAPPARPAPVATPPPRRVEPAAPAPPRRPVLEMLAAFMEARNILWGELVGGLLIVGCSIALVLSLRRTLEQIPYFPFVVLVAVTAAAFGVGFYSLRRWRLESTSRGLLAIGSLLVPLCFLALVMLSRGPAGRWIELALAGLAVAGFGALLARATPVLAPGPWWPLPLAVVGTGATELLPLWLLGEDPPAWRLLLLGAIPIAGYAAAVQGALGEGRLGASTRTVRDARGAQGVLSVVGAGAFALLLALAALLWQAGDLRVALPRMALLVAGAGLSVLAGGLRVHQGLAEVPHLGPWRTAGTVATLVGGTTMLVALGLAWPEPHWVMAVAWLDAAALTVLAVRAAWPGAHAGALPCTALGTLVAVHLLAGHLAVPGEPLARQMLAALGSASSASILLGLAAGWGAVAAGCLRAGAAAHGRVYAWGGGAAALASLGLATWHAPDHPALVSVVYGLTAVASLALSWVVRQPLACAGGLTLAVAASLWALRWGVGELTPVWGAGLGAEALGMGVLAVWLERHARSDRAQAIARVYASPLARGAEAVAPLAILAAVASRGPAPWSFAHVVTGICLVALYGLRAAADDRLAHARLGGAMLLGTAVAAAGWVGERSGLADVRALVAGSLGLTSALLALPAVWRGGVAGAGPGARIATWAGAWARAIPWAPALTVARREATLAAGALAVLAAATVDQGGESRLVTVTGALVAASLFGLAWESRVAAWTWAGSGLVLATLVHAQGWLGLPARGPLGSWLLPLLAHATLMLGASCLRAPEPEVRRVLLQPLRLTALTSSLLALWPLALRLAWLAVGHPPPTTALELAWLSAIWLVLAWTGRWRALFAGFQLGLALATYAVPIDLGWTGRWPASPWIALGVLALAWVVARIALRAHPVAAALLGSGPAAVDRVLLGLLVSGQLAAAILQLAAPAPAPRGEAWALLAVLALALAAGLWERWGAGQTLGGLALAVTVPVLGAEPFKATGEAGTALRWGLAGIFVLGSVALWARDALGAGAARWRWRVEPEAPLAPVARAALVGGAAAPVVGLTLALVLGVAAGTPPPMPAEGSLVGRLGLVTTSAVPLLLVALGLVGHALRETRAGHAFAAGLVVTLAVTGGETLRIALGPGVFDADAIARLVELAAVTAAAWALVWLGGLPRAGRAGRALAETPPSRQLLALQIGLGAYALGGLLVVALGALGVPEPSRPDWAVATGGPLGWLALGLTLAAGGVHVRRERARWWVDAAGLAGLAAIGLLACSLERGWAGTGPRALLLGWAAYAPAVALSAWAVMRTRAAAGPPVETEGRDAVTTWVGVAATLAVLLALKAAFVGDDRLGAAASLALVSSGAAIVAGWRRREGWAFGAALGVNAATSLVVWEAQAPRPVSAWWVPLVQANLVATASVALGWLGLRRALRALDGSVPGRWLSRQLAIGAGLQGLLLLSAALALVVRPGAVPPGVRDVGSLLGWLAAALLVAALAWYARATGDPRTGALPTVTTVGLGVLLASTAARWDDGTWLAYHTLMAGWAAGGLFALAGLARTAVPPPGSDRGSPTAPLRQTVGVLALGLVLLALRGAWEDPGRPGWSVAATLLASALIGALAFRDRSAQAVVASGLLMGVAGALVGTAGDRPTLLGFASTLSVGLALAAGVWSGVTGLERIRHPDRPVGPWPAFSRPATVAALALAAVPVVLGLLADVDLARPRRQPPDLQAWQAWQAWQVWCALGTSGLALVIALWDAGARLARPALYGFGLLVAGQALHAARIDPHSLGRTGAMAAAAYVVLTSAGWRAAPRALGLRRALRLPEPVGPPSARWLVPAQALVGGATTLGTLALALATAPTLVAPLATALLGGAGVLLASPRAGRHDARIRVATLALGVLALTEVGLVAAPGWAEATGRALAQSVAALVALGVATVAYGIGLGRGADGATGWPSAARRLAPWLGLLAVAALAGVLVQEAALQRVEGRVPLGGLAIGLVLLALGGLVATAIWFALQRGPDPLGLTDRRRALYVWVAELLLALGFVHLRLAAPRVFVVALAGRYWPWAVMALAFTGVGLGEVFRRRRLGVLGEPLEHTGLFLPLLPAVAFWLQPEPNYGRYALLWFLAGLLYGLLALSQRSTGFALVAAAAGNVGLWMVLKHHGVAFLAHPQLWLIPVSLTGLVAAQLNRDRLTPAQLAGTRYAALLGVYVSSTADLFITGLGNSVVLPLALALLSVLGVLAGIALRVRAFLFLGTTFLLLVLVALIWHAAIGRQQTWILWASGIVMGAAMLTLFALFEKRRHDVLRVVDELKQWA